MNEYQLADYETDLFLKALDGFSAQENPRAVPRLRKDEFLSLVPEGPLRERIVCNDGLDPDRGEYPGAHQPVSKRNMRD
jgi:hypothetical protein